MGGVTTGSPESTEKGQCRHYCGSQGPWRAGFSGTCGKRRGEVPIPEMNAVLFVLRSLKRTRHADPWPEVPLMPTAGLAFLAHLGPPSARVQPCMKTQT